MKAFSWVNFILGLWLIAAAFLLSHAAQPAMAEEIVLGIVIAVLSYISAVHPLSAISWLVALAGLWTLIAPKVIGYGSLAASRSNDVVVGIIVLVLGVANALHHETPVRTAA
jgi:hypothetical protein